MENNFVQKLNYIVLTIFAGLISGGIGFAMFLGLSKAGITVENGLSFAIAYVLIMNIVVFMNNNLCAYFYNVAYTLQHKGFVEKSIKTAIYQVIMNLVSLPFVFLSIGSGFLAIFILTICFLSINNLFEIFIFRESNDKYAGSLIGAFLTIMIAMSVAFYSNDLSGLFVPFTLLFLVLGNFLESLGSELLS